MFHELPRPVAGLTLAQRLIGQVTDEYDAKLKIIGDNAGRIAECEALAARLAATGMIDASLIRPIVTVHETAITERVCIFYESIHGARTAIRCAGLKIKAEDYDPAFGDMTFSLDGLDCPVIADCSQAEKAASLAEAA